MGSTLIKTVIAAAVAAGIWALTMGPALADTLMFHHG
jgi:hypothetical protein